MNPPMPFIYGFDPALCSNVYFVNTHEDDGNQNPVTLYSEKKLEARTAVIRETMMMKDYLDLRFDIEDHETKKRKGFTFRNSQAIDEFVREMGGHGSILNTRVLAYLRPDTGEVYAIAKAT